MYFKHFDSDASKERSDRLADLLRHKGIRIKRRVKTEAGRKPVHVIAVHPEDMDLANEVDAAAKRTEDEDLRGKLSFVRQHLTVKDMLFAREPNEAGYHASGVYHGKPFDETMFELVRGAWDHEHCYICYAKIQPGDEWWACHPPNFEDKIGLCLHCYVRLFGG